jgi:hypothetical protein
VFFFGIEFTGEKYRARLRRKPTAGRFNCENILAHPVMGIPPYDRHKFSRNATLISSPLCAIPADMPIK